MDQSDSYQASTWKYNASPAAHVISWFVSGFYLEVLRFACSPCAAHTERPFHNDVVMSDVVYCVVMCLLRQLFVQLVHCTAIYWSFTSSPCK